MVRPIGLTIIYLAIALFGYVSLQKLAIDLLPSVDVPWISITTSYEGVAPEEIETLLTRPIEQAVSTVEGVERIEATSAEGISRVQLQFTWGKDVGEAIDDVRVAIDRVRARLPDGADPPSVFKFDLASVPVAYLGVTGTGDPRRVKQLAKDNLTRAIERLPGVASVDVQGGRDREIRLELDSARLTALGVTGDQVAQALAKENRTVSAGEMLDGGHEVVIRTAGEFTSIDQIRSVVVRSSGPDGKPVLVRDLGVVVDSIVKARNELWIDEEPGVRLRVYKQSGANTVAVAKAVRKEIDRLNVIYEGRVRLTMLSDASEFIEAAVSNVQSSAVWGAGLASAILLLFLRSARATLVVSLAIPLSVIATFALMFWQGMTLNLISFGGLALGIGILVDGAVVILESIYRKRERGLDKEQAAIQGAHEVAGAVVAGTLTTVAVFVPVVFVGDLAGVLFGEMALVVTFALMCSLAVSLTLVPMLAARLLGDQSPSRVALLRSASSGLQRALDAVDAWYGRTIRAALTAPWAIVVGALVLLASSFLLVSRVGMELMPPSDEGRLSVSVELPLGTPLSRTKQIMLLAEERVRERVAPEELQHVITNAGPESWWRPGGGHEGKIELVLVPLTARARSSTEIEQEVHRALADLPGAKVQVRQTSSNVLNRIIRRGDDRLSVEVRGHDLAASDALGAEITALLQKTPGVIFARPDRELGRLERVLHVDRERAAEAGLGSSEVASAVELYVLGRVATTYREHGDEYDVRVQLRPDQRDRLDQLQNLPVLAGPNAATLGLQNLSSPRAQVPLGSLVRVEDRKAPSSIKRIDQERVLRINAGIGDRPLSEIIAEIQPKLADLSVPEGLEVRLAGELEEQGKTFSSLVLGILLALFLVYAVMAVQFESVRHPLVVMGSVPFAFIGVVGALVLTGTTFNMNSFLGAIVLVGIVVNNAIVLVDYTNLLRRRDGMPLVEALVSAGSRRLRPILMTTLTTLLGLVPLALGIGEGSEMQTPLARVVIGGLTTSTLVTLLLVPCVYLLVERGRERARAATPSATRERLAAAE